MGGGAVENSGFDVPSYRLVSPADLGHPLPEGCGTCRVLAASRVCCTVDGIPWADGFLPGFKTAPLAS